MHNGISWIINCFFFIFQAIACAIDYDDQHCGIYAGDEDSYKDFAEVFDPLICEYHGLDENFSHTSDMDSGKIKGNVNGDAPVKSTRIRVGRSIEGKVICVRFMLHDQMIGVSLA